MKTINILLRPAVYISVIICLGLSFSCMDDVYESDSSNWNTPIQKGEFDEETVFASIYASLALTGHDALGGNEGKWDGSTDIDNYAFFSTLFLLNELPTDEAITTWDDFIFSRLNFNYPDNSGTSIQLNFFKRLLYNIQLCEHYLENVSGSVNWDEWDERKMAEVRFLRILNYYYMVELFNPIIPLDDSDYWGNPFWKIHDELMYCSEILYEPTTAPYGRVDKAAAWLLLARLFLNAPSFYVGEYWAEAEIYARKVIESGYELAPVYSHLFMADNDGSIVNKANREIILPIRQHGIDTRGWSGSSFLIAATHSYDMPEWGGREALSSIRAKASLVKKFFPEVNDDFIAEPGDEIDFSDAGDDRALFYWEERTLNIYEPHSFNQGFSVTKWSNLRADGVQANSTTYSDTDIPFMRLGEAYLILAEALVMQGNIYQGLQTVNVLRTRANAKPLSRRDYINNEEILIEIMNERSRELYFEGHRRADLRRMYNLGYHRYSNYTWDWNGGGLYGMPDWDMFTYNLTNYSFMDDLRLMWY